MGLGCNSDSHPVVGNASSFQGVCPDRLQSSAIPSKKVWDFQCISHALREASRSRVGPISRFHVRRESARAPSAGAAGRASGTPEGACGNSAHLLSNLCADRRDHGTPAMLRKRGQICGRPLVGARERTCSGSFGQPRNRSENQGFYNVFEAPAATRKCHPGRLP